MTVERQVRLFLSNRAVPSPAKDSQEVARYAGIAVLRVEDGEVIEPTWIPVGTTPSYADDEILIAAWHVALQWSCIAG